MKLLFFFVGTLLSFNSIAQSTESKSFEEASFLVQNPYCLLGKSEFQIFKEDRPSGMPGTLWSLKSNKPSNTDETISIIDIHPGIMHFYANVSTETLKVYWLRYPFSFKTTFKEAVDFLTTTHSIEFSDTGQSQLLTDSTTGEHFIISIDLFENHPILNITARDSEGKLLYFK